jgi:hypothetical protein
MARTVFAASATLLLSGLVACGKEVGRIPFRDEGSANAAMHLQAGAVSFWSDLDIRYEGDAALAYAVELVRDGSVVASATCNPLGHMSVKLGWVETNWDGRHSRRGTGKMSCGARVPNAGATTVRARLAFSSRPATLTLTRADLVVKQ